TSVTNIVNAGATGLVMAGDIGDYHRDRKGAFSTISEKFPKNYHANLMLMLGNHDVRSGAKPGGVLDPDLVELYHSYLNDFGVKYYKDTMCIDAWIGGYHFLCLNTDVGLKDKMELNEKSLSWLNDKLAENANINNPIFVITHQAFNSSHWRAGLFGGFGDQDEELKSLFLEYPQIIMLSGHIHNGFGVIEFIQRPFGTLIEIPSLTKGENGIKDKGTGYLLKIDDKKLAFEAWDFYKNIRLQKFDQTLYLPSLSVLTKKLPDYDEGVGKELREEAAVLMSKKYINDIPSGNNTYLPQSHYGLDKIYGEDTWNKINTLRDKLINFTDKIIYYKFPFSNGETITEKMIKEALDKHDNIEIILYDGHWARDIYMPNVQKINQVVRISSNATFNTTITTSNDSILLERNRTIIFSSKGFWDIKN
uniref:metallophosphoesterase family protein n=1 Tax=Pectobacterium versatile TaxID=2488639 RepID=UPI001CC9D381